MSTAPDTGVIHDIGYRSYEGPRLGRSYATRSLFTQSLRAAYGLGRSGRSKVVPMLMIGLPVLMAAVFVAVAIMTQASKLQTDYARFLGTIGLLTYIFAASQAPALVSHDLRHNTMPLYFSRPITRRDYVRARFGAMFTALLIQMCVPLLVLYLGALLGKMPFGFNTEHLLYGLLAAVLYALVLTAVSLLIAAATPRRGFGVAAIMAVLMVSGIISQIVYALAGGFHRTGVESAQWARLLSPPSVVDSFVNQVCGLVATPQVEHAPGTVGVIVFAAEIVLLVVGSYGLLGRRYRNI